MQMVNFSLAFIAAVSLINCATEKDDGNGGDGGLTGKDYSYFAVAPCPTQNFSTDLATIKTDMLAGSITFLDTPYDAADADIYKKKCGLSGYWDPANATDSIAASGLGGITPSNIYANGNGGICATGAAPANGTAGFGIPQAGTYYHQYKVAYGTTTWLIRSRSTVSGAQAGNTWDSLGITDVSTFLNTTANYTVNGTDSPHDNAWTAIINGLTVTGDGLPTSTVVVSSTTPAVSWTTVTELFCATQI